MDPVPPSPRSRINLRQLLGIQPVVWRPREWIRLLGGGLFAACALLVCSASVFQKTGAEWLVASMGASVVLLIGSPGGPLSQPWPVIGGHTVSALIGVACAQGIPHQTLAAGSAVAIAIVGMHVLGCVHPPGGATALTAVVAGPAVRELGFAYAWSPVFLNACTLTLLAIIYHAVSGHNRYPAAIHAGTQRR